MPGEIGKLIRDRLKIPITIDLAAVAAVLMHLARFLESDFSAPSTHVEDVFGLICRQNTFFGLLVLRGPYVVSAVVVL